MLQKFVIEGGRPLCGQVRLSGNKNEALPALAACLLTDEPVILRNVPDIEDVCTMLGVLRSLGCQTESLGPNAWRVHCSGTVGTKPDPQLCRRIRASILVAGPILARGLEVELAPPGGDVIGRRRLDTHFQGLMALGVQVEVERCYRLWTTGLRGTEVFLDEASVTATENVLMAAVLARGTTTVINAACEPHVQGLCALLNAMGARIRGVGSNTLVIEGVGRLHGTEYAIGPDYLEAGSFVGLAAVTHGELEVVGARPSDMRKILMDFSKFGIHCTWSEAGLVVPRNQRLEVRPDLHGAIPKIDDAPWPQFPTDMMSIAIVCATQARGTVLFFEKMFDGRMFFVDHLIGMGAQIIQCDPHRVVVVGPARLYGTVVESPDIRAGMALVIASLCASGQATIYNIRQIDRGYERMDDKLRSIGAHIARVEV